MTTQAALAARPRRRWKRRILVGLGILVVGFIGLAILGTIVGPQDKTGSSGGGGSQSAPAQSVQYPPKSLSDLQDLADSAMSPATVTKREMLSFPHCACRLSATVPAGLPERDTAAALLAAFFSNGLDKQLDASGADGGVVLFGYHKASQIGGPYTAGRVDLRLASGTHTLTLDIGSAMGQEKEYVVSW